MWWRERWPMRWRKISASPSSSRTSPGAGTIIGTQSVATSDPDGYTLLMGTFANAVNPSLYAKLPYDQHRDLAPVALVARSFNIVVVNPASPIRSIADLIAAAKAEPDKLSYGTYGTGTSAHLAGELFKHMAGVNLTTVPYKGTFCQFWHSGSQCLHST